MVLCTIRTTMWMATHQSFSRVTTDTNREVYTCRTTNAVGLQPCMAQRSLRRVDRAVRVTCSTVNLTITTTMGLRIPKTSQIHMNITISTNNTIFVDTRGRSKWEKRGRSLAYL